MIFRKKIYKSNEGKDWLKTDPISRAEFMNTPNPEDCYVRNAVSRLIPRELNGRRLKPFAGLSVSSLEPGTHKVQVPIREFRSGRGGKLLASIDEAIDRAGLRDGMTISFHHHLRLGDGVVNMVMERIAAKGIKDLRLAQTALFDVHNPIIPLIEDGVVTRIEGSVNGPVGLEVSRGKLKSPAILRSHGGRVRAIQAGELKIDIAFIAASQADEYGNATGRFGKSAFGALGYAWADCHYANKVVVITDEVVPYPCTPFFIPQTHVDYVVEVDSIGNPALIASGTLKITSDPTRLEIASQVVEVLEKAGYLKDGFSFQAGAGGISLAVVKFLGDHLREKGIKGSFAMGGVTGYLTRMLEEGTIRAILDTQTFDLAGVESLRRNPGHQEISTAFYANPHNKGCVVNREDVSFLGATEVDLDFNVNVNTHSTGMLLHGTGGHSDAAMASLCFITVPLVRGKKNNIPVIRDQVTTVTTPGESIDLVVTDAGIAVNPRQEKLRKHLEGAGLPLKTMKELQKMAYDIAGAPLELELSDEIVALIEYRDGTIIDTVRRVKDFQ